MTPVLLCDRAEDGGTTSKRKAAPGCRACKIHSLDSRFLSSKYGKGILESSDLKMARGNLAVNQCVETTKFEVIPGISTIITALETLYNCRWRGNSQ